MIAFALLQWASTDNQTYIYDRVLKPPSFPIKTKAKGIEP